MDSRAALNSSQIRCLYRESHMLMLQTGKPRTVVTQIRDFSWHPEESVFLNHRCFFYSGKNNSILNFPQQHFLTFLGSNTKKEVWLIWCVGASLYNSSDLPGLSESLLPCDREFYSTCKFVIAIKFMPRNKDWDPHNLFSICKPSNGGRGWPVWGTK